MAAPSPPPRIDNFAAAIRATKDVLPYGVLFFALNFFFWYQGTPGPYNDLQLVQNLLFVSLLTFGFWVIDFFRARGRMKAGGDAQPRVIYVQQPVYVPAPPGYVYPPYPPYPAQGAPGAPTTQPPAPADSPPPAQKPPPEGSA